MSLIPLLPYLPNNVRHSASLGFNYDILDNLKISVGGICAMANRILAQLRVMKQSKAVIILWLIMVRQIVKT
jgi:hypothetical protein